MKNLLFIDVEATGTEEEDRLLQVAYNTKDTYEYRVNAYFKPQVPIKIPAMAVHHITEKMVTDKQSFVGSSTFIHLESLAARDYIFVAHNAKYDLGMFLKEGIDFKKSICTLKVARFVDDGSFENHQLQYLRYYYGLDVEVDAHDAFGDIIVLEGVFWKLYEKLGSTMYPDLVIDEFPSEPIIDKMIEISSLPTLLRVCNFKKHKGKTWEEVAKIDLEYMQWFRGQSDLDEDLKYTLDYYLNK